MTAETLVLSAALYDPDYVPQVAPVLLRALKLVDRDPDYVASVKDGFTESFAAFDARLAERGM